MIRERPRKRLVETRNLTKIVHRKNLGMKRCGWKIWRLTTPFVNLIPSTIGPSSLSSQELHFQLQLQHLSFLRTFYFNFFTGFFNFHSSLFLAKDTIFEKKTVSGFNSYCRSKQLYDFQHNSQCQILRSTGISWLFGGFSWEYWCNKNIWARRRVLNSEGKC